MENNNSSDKQPSKPTYDGRQVYFKIVENYMAQISICQYMGDLPSWVRLARGMFSLFKAYIVDKDCQIQNRLALLEHNLNEVAKTHITKENREALYRGFDKQLQSLTDDIYMQAKLILLPVGADETTDYDKDDFLRGSE